MKTTLLRAIGSMSIFMFAVFLIFALSVSAATILKPGYSGDKIKPGFQTPVKADGEQMGVYTNDDLSIRYHYARNGENLKIWGVVDFGSGTQFSFNYVDYFNLGLLLGDADGKILADKSLVSTSWVNLTNVNNQVAFSTQIKIPANTNVMAFTYTGQASEGGSGGRDASGGGNTQFWQYPIVS